MNLDVQALHPASDANKYTRGKLILVAGSERYPGAAALAARASQRMGAGYTEVVTARGAVNAVRLASPSLVVRAFDDWQPSSIPESRPGKPCAVCLGPGFVGDGDEGRKLVACVLKAACPVLVDGGGLADLVAPKALKRLQKRAEQGFETVVTPHGGEAARLASALGLVTGAHSDGPQALATSLSRALRVVVVLKGPITYIADGERVEAMEEGTPALAKAGTGDVLAGMVSALLAQGFPAFESSVLGATLHARAGVAAAERLTDISVIAEDVIESIPEVLK